MFFIRLSPSISINVPDIEKNNNLTLYIIEKERGKKQFKE